MLHQVPPITVMQIISFSNSSFIVIHFCCVCCFFDPNLKSGKHKNETIKIPTAETKNKEWLSNSKMAYQLFHRGERATPGQEFLDR